MGPLPESNGIPDRFLPSSQVHILSALLSVPFFLFYGFEAHAGQLEICVLFSPGT